MNSLAHPMISGKEGREIDDSDKELLEGIVLKLEG